MEVVSLSPFRVGSLLWQPRRGAWALTVVCKSTYSLAQGEARLAVEQEYPNDDDNHWNDDPARSLHSPTDLVPFKARADVMLIGHAFVPHGEPVRSAVVRLAVGTVDKSIEVVGERFWGPDGHLRDAARWTKMPLRYERAGGGQDTDNPVGIRADAKNGAPIANLQRPGLVLADAKTVIEPIGFGPISPSWPERRQKLGRHAATWSDQAWHRQPLPDDLDPGYFNAAPRDQQVEELGDDERIVLDNLHPEHPQIVTKLPGMHPRAFFDRPGAAPHDLAMIADTLWIDTDRAICTLTWRGQVPLDSPRLSGRVLVALEGPGQRLSWTDVERLAGRPPEGTVTVAVPHPTTLDPPSARPTAVGRSRPGQDDLTAIASRPRVVHGPPAGSAPAGATAPGVTANEPDVLPVADRTSSSVRPFLAVAAAVPSPAPVAEPATPQPHSGPRASGVARASSPGLTATARGAVVELLWFDADAVPRMRATAGFREIAETASKPLESVLAIVTRGPLGSAEAVSRAIAEAVSGDGTFAPPMVLCAGELLFPFDEIEALKATVSVASPLAQGATKLKEAVDSAHELLKSPWVHSASAALEMIARIQEAFAQNVQQLPVSYLDAQANRILLEHRHYQRRIVLGETTIRSLLVPTGGTTPIPTYLPETLWKKLPMFQTLAVRLVAEAHVQQDQYESHPCALKVSAIARIVTPAA